MPKKILLETLGEKIAAINEHIHDIRTEDYQVYSFGHNYFCVCAKISAEEVIVQVKKTHYKDWEVATDLTFAAGRPSGCPCPRHPETHKHFLYVEKV